MSHNVPGSGQLEPLKWCKLAFPQLQKSIECISLRFSLTKDPSSYLSVTLSSDRDVKVDHHTEVSYESQLSLERV